MQGLKILVIAMGIVILIGLTVVIVTVASRLKGGGQGFAGASLVLPKGCRVMEMAAAGAKLALRLGEGPDCQAILFLDPETGREAGRVSLLSQP